MIAVVILAMVIVRVKRKSIDADGVQENEERDVELCVLLAELLWDRQPAPLMGLASGRGSLADKFHAVVQAGFCVGGGVSHDTHITSLSEFCNEIVGACGDMGVEFSLPCVLPVGIQRLYPWMPVPQVENPTTEADDWSFDPAAESVPVPVSFSRAFQVP